METKSMNSFLYIWLIGLLATAMHGQIQISPLLSAWPQTDGMAVELGGTKENYLAANPEAEEFTFLGEKARDGSGVFRLARDNGPSLLASFRDRKLASWSIVWAGNISPSER